MYRVLFAFVAAVALMFDAGALTIGAVESNNGVNNVDLSNGVAAAAGVSTDDMAKLSVISTLEDDIFLLQTELQKCQKNKKGWIAATVIGSAGVVATGVAAGVQGAQLSKKKAELKEVNAKVSAKQDELNSINGGGK